MEVHWLPLRILGLRTIAMSLHMPLKKFQLFFPTSHPNKTPKLFNVFNTLLKFTGIFQTRTRIYIQRNTFSYFFGILFCLVPPSPSRRGYAWFWVVLEQNESIPPPGGLPRADLAAELVEGHRPLSLRPEAGCT
jgi:hypothetical protein